MAEQKKTRKTKVKKPQREPSHDPTLVSLRLQKWREEQARKESIITKQKEDQKRREEIFITKFASEDILADAWQHVFRSLGLSLDLCRCSMTCKFWNGLITEGKNCTFSEYFFKMFTEHKPLDLTWAQVFSSLPTLFLILNLNTPFTTEVNRYAVCRSTFSDLKGPKVRQHVSSLFQWAVVYGYLGLMEKLATTISEDSVKPNKTHFKSLVPISASLCCSSPLWSPKLTLNLCLGNGHLKVLSHVLKQFPEMLRSFPDIDQFVASLVASTESADTILEISSYLNEKDLYHLVFQTFMIGDVEVVEKLLQQGKTTLFNFTGGQCSEIISKCFRDGSQKAKVNSSAWQEELDQTLSQLRISEVTMKEVRKRDTVEKNFTMNKLKILKMVIDHDLFQKISMNQIVPSVGPAETYKFYVDNIQGSPVDFAFALCTSAKNATDYEVFDYLFSSGKCHPNVKNRFGNGLVYTAFINGNSRLLNILLKADADPNIYVNNANDSLFDLALHSTLYLKSQGEGIKEELLLPCLKVLVQFKDLKYPPFNQLLNFPCFLSSALLLPSGVPLDYADDDGLTVLQRAIFYSEDMAEILNVINHPTCTATVINYHTDYDESIPSFLPALALLLSADRQSEEDQFLIDGLIKGGADVDIAYKAIKNFDYSVNEDLYEEGAMKRIKSLMNKYPSGSTKSNKTTAKTGDTTVQTNSGSEAAIPKAEAFSFSFDNKFAPTKTEENQSAFSFSLADLEKGSKGNVASGFTFGDSAGFSFLSGEKK